MGVLRTLGLNASYTRMIRPAHDQPSQLISTDSLRFPIGAGSDSQFPDAEIIQHLIDAEEVLEARLYSPLQTKVIEEFYRLFTGRFNLSIRPIGDAGLGAITGAPGDSGGAKPAKPSVELNGETMIDPDRYIVDTTSYVPAVVFTDTMTPDLSDHLENPIKITYEYTPIVPNRVKAALTQGVRAFFLARSAGMPFPQRNFDISVGQMLDGLLPINVGDVR